MDGLSNEIFENKRFLGKVVVRMGMKVSIGVCLFLVHMVDHGTIWLRRDENIQKRKRIFLFEFHGKLNVGRDVVKVAKQRIQ